ncbi:TPA: helix-turn-helix domain-containing protein [Enterococcus faecium]|uniref:XRE family transcriptional regulator n=1 Tax=Enterococcus TaxID=1350 RepID=UPI00093567FD|nr:MULTISPECIES: S24 family peptidase [Enterococcus]MBC9722309.1 helix-turn-helix domain-containing protein [Lactobacillus sp.]MDB7366972.1 helix-turn-helix domain-containing protein [Enterococcus faecium]MDB7520725.1 helix-turn-helix domain-containing protein [Enterococcus faecium]MDB7523465.1 helix-turn-helix domain-containing protein [Enterococcus faecium]MDB7525934.1 helix-turn-helix domain-containing protein [Enterococcus faecium]
MKKNILGSVIKDARKKKKLTQEQLSKLTGYSQNTISNHENGNRSLDEDNIKTYATALDLTPDDLFEALDIKNSLENKMMIIDKKQTKIDNLLDLYSQLEESRQTKVYNFAEQQLEEQNRGNVVHFPKKEKLPTIKNSASAANPTELVYGDTVVEEEEFERVPNNADFAVPIIGDSMEPVIRNGQFVFVKEQPDVEDGEIAIVEIDGDGVTCKEVYKDYESQTIILHSINELYEDRVVSPEQIRIIGKVVF